VNTEITEHSDQAVLSGSPLAAPGRAIISPERRSPPCRGWTPGALVDWLPLMVLPTAAFAARNLLTAWVFMWLMAAAIFFGCKWLTWRRACRRSRYPGLRRCLAYLFAWPGMDGSPFCDRPSPPGKLSESLKAPEGLIWVFAAAKALGGAALLGLAARGAWTGDLRAGWLGMLGLVLFLHFGVFHLLALAWQRAGVNVEPIMRAPLIAASLSEFWSTRWNTAFNVLAHDLAFRPLARRCGIVCGTIGVFLISGVIHETVISVPARAGCGLPTAYFAVQALGVLAERSRWGRRAGLGCGWRGWVFVVVLTAGPVFWLFHPPFVRNVIMPMLNAIGAK